MDDIFVYVTELPPSINEAISPCLDGYTVYINQNLSKDSQIEAYTHALSHIINNDFEKTDVQEIEIRAHN